MSRQPRLPRLLRRPKNLRPGSADTIPAMNLRALAAVTLVALVTVLPAASQETAPSANVYNIEIVVFRANQALGGAENWNVQASRNYGTGDETGNSSRNVGRFVNALPTTSFQLTDVENKLRASGIYV